MSRPASRDQLLPRIDTDFAALMAAVNAVPADHREQSGACGQWSVKDLLAHIDAWHELFLGWEQPGRRAEPVTAPAPGFTWKQTPELNEQIWQRTREDSWSDVVARLDDSHTRVRNEIATYSDEELFTKKYYAWTGSTSVGSSSVSATTSHYAWASKLIRAFARTLPSG